MDAFVYLFICLFVRVWDYSTTNTWDLSEKMVRALTRSC